MPNPIKGFQTKDGVRKYDYNELENLPETDPDDLALEVEEIKENIESKKDNVIKITASGDIASFSDGADDYPVKDLVANIEPVQDLHGYANPWPGGGGKNKLKITATSTTINGITYTVNEDGTVVANGTASDSSTLVLSSGRWLPDLDGDLILNGSVGGYGNSIRTRFGVSNPDATYDDFGNGVTIPQISNLSTKYAYVQITISSGTTVNNIVFKPMLRLATETDATFEPYSNICPITGWTGANVTRTGKNLLDASTCIIRNYINSRGKIEATQGWSASDYIPVKNGETYTLSNYNPSGNAARHAFYGIDKSFLSSILAAGNNTFTVPSGAYYVRVTIKTENPTGAQLELGSTATDYEPYQGDTYAVTFPTEAGTVYGGTLDVTTGVLTVDKGFRTLDGNDGSTYSENGQTAVTTRAFVDIPNKAPGRNNMISDMFIGSLEGDDFIGKMDGRSANNGIEFFIPVTVPNTVSGVVAWFAENKPTLCYELATPTTYQCTPTEVKTLLGANNIFADTGAVDVEYCADTKKYIDNAIAAAVASLS